MWPGRAGGDPGRIVDALGEIMTSDITAPLAQGDTVVLDYLAALWAESDYLSPELRDELMATVADYIAMRRVDAAPHEVVGRLGPPEALVAAAHRGAIPPHLRRPVITERVTEPATVSEYTAVALLTVGAVVVPVAAPLAGLIMASGSPRWTPSQKAAAWVVSSGSVAASMVFALFAVASDGIVPLVLTFFALVAGPFVAGLSLLPALHDAKPRRPGERRGQ
jgi:hypothetical protein